jgi:hypothetical protein
MARCRSGACSGAAGSADRQGGAPFTHGSVLQGLGGRPRNSTENKLLSRPPCLHLDGRILFAARAMVVPSVTSLSGRALLSRPCLVVPSVTSLSGRALLSRPCLVVPSVTSLSGRAFCHVPVWSRLLSRPCLIRPSGAKIASVHDALALWRSTASVLGYIVPAFFLYQQPATDASCLSHLKGLILSS